MEDARALLDELMDHGRHVLGAEVEKERTVHDPDVDKFYLAGMSLFYEFKNTKTSNMLMDAYRQVCGERDNQYSVKQ